MIFEVANTREDMDIPASRRGTRLLADQLLHLFEDGPQHGAAAKLESDHKFAIDLLLAINDFGTQGGFSHCGNDLDFLAELPGSAGVNAGAKGADIFDHGSFPPFGVRAFGRHEIDLHHDGKPFLFSSSKAIIQSHAVLFSGKLAIRAGIALGLGAWNSKCRPGGRTWMFGLVVFRFRLVLAFVSGIPPWPSVLTSV